MEYYKKIPLKFSHERASRELRNSEALKARNSSRFKRLSMIRNISDSDLVTEDSVEFADTAFNEVPKEATQENKNASEAFFKVPASKTTSADSADVPQKTENNLQSSFQNERKGNSRLEMLFKWKQEKMLKLEIEKKSKKKPFYAGKSQPLPSVTKSSQDPKSSFMTSMMSFNISRMANSRIAGPSSTQSRIGVKTAGPSSSQSRIGVKTAEPSSSQSRIGVKAAAPSRSVQPPQPRIGYNFKAASTVVKVATTMSKDNPSSLKKPAIGGIPRTAIGNKTDGLAKSTKNFVKSVPMKTTYSSGPKAKISDNTASKSTNQFGVIPRAALGTTKPAVMKKNESSANKVPSQSTLVSRVVSKAPSTSVSRSGKDTASLIKPGMNKNAVTKPLSQVSLFPKFGVRMPSKAIQPPKKTGSTVPKPASNAGLVPKPTSVPSKGAVAARPASQVPAVNKLRKPDSLKAPGILAVKNSLKPSDKAAAVKTVTKPTVEEKTDAFKETSGEEEAEEFNESSRQVDLLEEIPENADSIFKCDVSVIKPPSSSFAPDDFKFQPPILPNFFEEDLFDALEKAKQKFTRTSTPSKCGSEEASNVSLKKLNDSQKEESITEADKPESICDEMYKVSVRGPRRTLSSGEFIFKETPDILMENTIFEVEERPSYNAEVNNSVNSQDVAAKQIVTSDVGDKLPVEKNVEILQNKTDGTQCNTVQETEENASEESTACKTTGMVEDSDERLANETGGDSSFIKKEKDGTAVAELEKDCSVIESGILPSLNQVKLNENSLFTTSLNNSVEDNNPDENLLFTTSPPEMSMLDEVNEVVEDQIQKLNDEEEQDSDDIPDYLDAIKIPERKSSGAIPKRCSLLKRVSVLNSIIEIQETNDQTPSTSLKRHQPVTPLRRSTRLSFLKSDIESPCGKASNFESNDTSLLASPECKSQDSPLPQHSKRLSRSLLQQCNTPDAHKKLPVEDEKLLNFSPAPRRSFRLQNAVPKDQDHTFQETFSPFGKENCATPRRSMRLINLQDTPEGGACGGSTAKTHLTADFKNMRISSRENLDSDDLLIDFNNSPVVSRKISLLYSPQKRKSIRRSIKGDLMSFSPSGKN